MSDKYIVSDSGIGALIEVLAKSGRRVLGPKTVAERIEIAEIKSATELVKDGQSIVSAKGTVFPKVERLMKYRYEGKGVALDDVEPNATPTVLVGVRPCEARAFHA